MDLNEIHHYKRNYMMKADMHFNNTVIYPNQYITISADGYTKHYFAGTERIATSIGGGGFCYMTEPVVNLQQYEKDRLNDIINYLNSYLTDQENNPPKNRDIENIPLPELHVWYINLRKRSGIT